jgi:hypothetical protein
LIIGPGWVYRAAWLAALAPGRAEDFDGYFLEPRIALDEISRMAQHSSDHNGISFDQEAGFHLELRDVQALVDWRLPVSRANALRSLGALSYRAGRFDEARTVLEEKIRLSSGESTPQDWAFMSLILNRLGRRGEALEWLGRFRGRRPSDHPMAFWDELEIRLLRSEAEAVVLHDPVFPADPFAPPSR